MQTWTITYEDEDDNGEFIKIKEVEIEVPEDAGILKDSSWASWLVAVHEPSDE